MSMQVEQERRQIGSLIGVGVIAPLEPFWTRSAGVALVRIGIAAMILAAWEFGSGTVINNYWLSQPSLVALRLYEWVSTGFILMHLQATLTSAILGFGLGALSGILLGLLLGASPFLSDVLRPYIVGFYAIPKVALVPLLILWFGIGLASIVALVAMTVLFPVFYNTFAGVRNVDKELIDAVRIMGAGRMALFVRVMIPASAAWIFAGLKIAVRYALTTTIYGELIGGNRGIGYLLEYSAGRFDTTGIMAAIVILVFLGLLLVWTVMHTEVTTKKG